MSFQNDAALIEQPGRRYTINQPLFYHGDHDQFEIPKGFTTDLGSVPRIFWWLASPSSHLRPFILHDWLWHLNRKNEGPDPVDSDGLLRRSLREVGVGRATRWLIWAAVRAAAVFTGRPGRWGWRQLIPFAAALIPVVVVMTPPAVLTTVWVLVLRAADLVLKALIDDGPQEHAGR